MSITHPSARAASAAAFLSCLAVSAAAHAGGDGRLLILYDGTFHDQVEDYRDWKLANDPGLDAVEMVDVSIAGSDAGDIDDFLTLYWNLHPDVKYLLLVGDEISIPPTWEPDASNPSNTIASDHDYANLDADDEPELAVGRIIPFDASVAIQTRRSNLANQFAKIEAQHDLAITSPLYDKMLMALPFLDDVEDATATVGAVTYKADGTATAGTAGNAYKIRYVLAANGMLSVVTNAAAKTIQVNLGRYPGGGSSTTTTAVANAINSHAVAGTWVDASPVPGLEMAAQSPVGWVYLAGGADSTGIPSTGIVESGEGAVLHLLDMQKTVVRAYNATSVDEFGDLLPGAVAPAYIDNRATVTIADFSPAIVYDANGFDWSDDAADITDALDDGVETVVYMGHGNPTVWAAPHFTTDDADALANTAYPVVFNFACSTGNYPGNDSLAEAFLQNPSGGASAVFSATSTVVGGANIGLADYIEGLVDSIDDGYDPLLSHAGQDLHRIGDRVVYMKKFIIAAFGDASPENLHDHLHQFTLFGDPTMRYNPFK